MPINVYAPIDEQPLAKTFDRKFHWCIKCFAKANLELSTGEMKNCTLAKMYNTSPSMQAIAYSHLQASS